MGIVCKIRGHRWHKTPGGEDGCCCERCGERNYSPQGWPMGECDFHKQPGSCEATCSWCGAKREIHDWSGCTCSWCGEVRDFDHEWQHVAGTCDFKCSVCGKVSDDKKSHKWAGCTCARCGAVRNEGHDFAPTEGGRLACTVCGISAAKAAAEMLEEAHRMTLRRDEKKKEGLIREACDIIRQIGDPVWLADVAPLAPFCVIERLAELGADEELARIARSDGDTYSYKAKCEAHSLIKDDALRESIGVRMTGMEAVWYEYDIKSGM